MQTLLSFCLCRRGSFFFRCAGFANASALSLPSPLSPFQRADPHPLLTHHLLIAANVTPRSKSKPRSRLSSRTNDVPRRASPLCPSPDLPPRRLATTIEIVQTLPEATGSGRERRGSGRGRQTGTDRRRAGREALRGEERRAKAGGSMREPPVFIFCSRRPLGKWQGCHRRVRG